MTGQHLARLAQRGTRWLSAAGALSALGWGMLAAGCIEREATGEEPATAAAQAAASTRAAAHQPLAGADQRSWLTRLGSLGDANYCQADLILPLPREPAWTVSYTSAQFSPLGPRNILHYDGTLVVTSVGPQLMGLDPRDGHLRFNRDVYYRDSQLTGRQQVESLTGVFISPQGLLLGRDNSNTFYLWSLDDPAPQRLWVRTSERYTSSMIAGPERWYATWDGALHGSTLSPEREQWTTPTLLDGGGIVASAGDTVIWYQQGEVRAMNGSSGKLLWSLSSIESIDRLIINDGEQAVYLTYNDEHLERRKLSDGELDWSYRWSDVLSPAEREERYAWYTSLDIARRVGLSLPDVGAFCLDSATGPDGVYLALLSGHTLAVDHRGKLRWIYHGPCPAVSGLALRNAFLTIELYQSPQTLQPIYARLLPFCRTEPPWQRLRDAGENDRNQLTYWNVVALDPVTGAVLDQFEPEQLVTTGPTPAYNMLVFGQQAMADSEQNRIIAYPWLQWEER